MKTKFFLLLIISAILLSITSCNEDDFNPRSDWKDISIVYGFINPSESTHYIRVFKAFLGDGDAVVMAQNPDSVYYPENALAISVKHYDIKNGTLKNTFYPDRVVLDDREPGVFTTKNIAYKFDHTFDGSADKNDSLVLEIEVIETGKKIYAKTDFISFGFHRQAPPSIKLGTTSATMELRAINGVKMVEMYLTYYYEEAPAGTTDASLREKKSIVWKMAEQELDKTVSNPKISYVPDQFFSVLKETLEDDPSVNRYNTQMGRLVVWAGSMELYYYNNLNKPSGIVLDRPEYTNITSNTGEKDVYGIFTSRFDNGFDATLDIKLEELRTIDRQFVPYP